MLPPFLGGKICLLKILQSSVRSTSDLIGLEAFSLTNAVLVLGTSFLVPYFGGPIVQVTQLRLSMWMTLIFSKMKEFSFAQVQAMSDPQQRLHVRLSVQSFGCVLNRPSLVPS